MVKLKVGGILTRMTNDEYIKRYFSKITHNAQLSLEKASIYAKKAGSKYITIEHLLLGILDQPGSIGSIYLKNIGSMPANSEIVIELKGAPKNPDKFLGLSGTAKSVIEEGLQIASQAHQQICGTEHILYGLLIQEDDITRKILDGLSIDKNQLVMELESYIKNQQNNFHHKQKQEKQKMNESAKKNNNSGSFGQFHIPGGIKMPPARTKKSKNPLAQFALNLSDEAASGRLDRLIGRSDELSRIITVLSRRRKNNPVLIGEPGVGKTAIIEGLAQAIFNQDVPMNLINKQVYSLDMASLVAGTQYRGQFEERLKNLINEVENRIDVILFIDEMHMIIGAGSTDNNFDAANMLKPALARGRIHLIGATTTDEYRKFIEKDPALERRLQPIIVDEPSEEDAFWIMKSQRSSLEQHHGVKISDEQVKEAIKLSERYIPDRFLPDKAIDVLDEAAAKVRARAQTIPVEFQVLTDAIADHDAKLQQAVEKQDFKTADRIKVKLINMKTDLEKQVDSAFSPKNAIKLKDVDILSAVATISGVPLTSISRNEVKSLDAAEKSIKDIVIGQSDAIHQVIKAIKRSKMGLGKTSGPMGSFIFLGPSGVGKTLSAKILAEQIFKTKKSLIKIDMSEFSEKHTASRLVGSPAGYVGYEDGGKLTEAVRRNPYSLILLDEIEKAHPDIFNLLLQVLEDGYLSDAKGRKISFKNTIIIMTGNIGAAKLNREAALGFGSKKSALKDANLEQIHEENIDTITKELKKFMRPELLSRITATVIFKALNKDDIKKIIAGYISDLNHKLGAKLKIKIALDASAVEYFIENGYKPEEGVRPLLSLMESEIEDKIVDGFSESRIKAGSSLKFKVKEGAVIY